MSKSDFALCSVCIYDICGHRQVHESGEAHLKKTKGPFGRTERIAPTKQHPLTPYSSQSSANPPLQVEEPSIHREASVARMTFISSCGVSSGSSMSLLKTLVFTNGENVVLRAAGGKISNRKHGPTKSDTPLPAPFWHHPLRCQLPDSLRFWHPVRHGDLGCGPPPLASKI